jgi:hypothetical protein
LFFLGAVSGFAAAFALFLFPFPMGSFPFFACTVSFFAIHRDRGIAVIITTECESPVLFQ